MYELHNLKPSFPITFNSIRCDSSWKSTHWHENLELLNITAGSAKAIIGNNSINVKKGDTAVVNTCEMHQLLTDDFIEYHYLIVDTKFLQQFELDLTKVSINTKIHDENINSLLEQLHVLASEKPLCYEIESCAIVLKIVSIMIRNYAIIDYKSAHSIASKIEAVKSATNYIRKNLSEKLTLDNISSYVGFNKYYLCRTFKEVTGISIMSMVNFLRCNEAERLITTSDMSISEIAEKCGYSNLSYFARTYKSIIGCLPSDTKRV